MLKSSLVVAGIHVAGWLLFLSLIAAFAFVSPQNANGLNRIFSSSFVVFAVIYILIFYINGELLLPGLYLKKRYVLYVSVLLLMLFCTIMIQPFDHLLHNSSAVHSEPRNLPPPFSNSHRPPPLQNNPPPERGNPGRNDRRIDIVSVILFVMIWSLSTAQQLLQQWRNTQEKVARAEADKANAELSFLKARINPHFLFNTLNNIYALALTNHAYTAEAIMKLSNIMRYVTDEAFADFVPLENEVECITNYIDLHRLRLSKKVTIDYAVTGNIKGRKIAPLVLMTFVENVFKYGTSNHKPSAITIALRVESSFIHLFCSNPVFEDITRLERTGIGIANTRQRLQFLYPEKHQLDIKEQDKIFSVDLKLES